MERLNVLSLSTVFPNPLEPDYGPFVHSRLHHLAELASVKVIAPIALLNYGTRTCNAFSIPYRRQESRLEVFHPRWLYPPLGGGLNPFFLSAQVVRLCVQLRSRFEYSIIDSHFGYPEGVAAACLSGLLSCPFTVTLRGNEVKHAAFPWRRRLMRQALIKASHVIAVSESLRDFALSIGVPANNITVIPNGINKSHFYMQGRDEARSHLGITTAKFIVLSVGSLTERKGHHRVIRSLRKLRENGCDAELYILGRRGHEDRFEQRIHKEVIIQNMVDKVHFVGYVEPATLAEYMSAADVLCLASSREGSPNVIHEALGCGLPVVATNVGGVRDLVRDQINGVVVPSLEDEAFATGLRSALTRSWDRAQIARAGQERSWQRVAIEVLHVLCQSAARTEHAH